MGDVTLKRCPRCGEAKTPDAFNRDAHTKDGLRSWCRQCTRAASKAHHRANPLSKEERRKQAARTRAWNRANRDRHRAGSDADRDRHPDRRSARNAVNNALKAGKVVKGLCEVCGIEDVHAHHDDHTQKLAVRWLCVEHHAEADRERRRLADAAR